MNSAIKGGIAIAIIATSVFACHDNDDNRIDPGNIESVENALFEFYRDKKTTVLTADFPAASTDADAPDVHFFEGDTIFMFGSQTLDLEAVTIEPVAGLNLKVKGSGDYIRVGPYSPGYGTGNLRLRFSNGIKPGHITLLYSVFDGQNRNSEIHQLELYIMDPGANLFSSEEIDVKQLIYTFPPPANEIVVTVGEKSTENFQRDFYCNGGYQTLDVKREVTYSKYHLVFKSDGSMTSSIAYDETSLDWDHSYDCTPAYTSQSFELNDQGMWGYNSETNCLLVHYTSRQLIKNGNSVDPGIVENQTYRVIKNGDKISLKLSWPYPYTKLEF